MNLREELTTKIHSDFYCSKEDDIRNRMFALLTSAKNDDEKIKEYLNNFRVTKDYHYKFEIVNYTCSSSGQYMKKHMHNDCAFTAVHYIKFNKEEHRGTTFHNKHPHVDFIPSFKQKFYEMKDMNDITNSWAMKAWTFGVEEDDICFSPAKLMHSVSQPKGDDLRITIVMNIDIEE